MSIYTDPKLRPALDESLYSPDSEELAFYKSETGIADEEQLKKHIIAAQTKAYEVYGYPCIRSFGFMRMKISRLPAYPRVKRLVQERESPILLDIGCCFGNDARKAVVDGWPVQDVIASDLRQDFWQCGHDLFKTTPASFPAAFVAGDAFDDLMIAPRAPFYEKPETLHPALNTLASLTPLQGHISAIHASSFFHLFDEAQQEVLARRVATLLSPEPGSVIFGLHGGLPEKGLRAEVSRAGRRMFCHSPDGWRELWDGQVFSKGTVQVEATLKEYNRPGPLLDTGAFYLLIWSVTRI
ncbi:uncharacterized protein LACBIDRAFT_297150 [Laccaria bicolor S238N-H82]|uniref:Predicted protein n=1 Tax=Laccaria bicolor (strain S238N-H82 / ATCC MYA-4686) TaxID=486041 RepID=B0DA42_LACBS|nr:uncharacterized protein LACBIDRAFT_297150 [Laccaria bicolor S238N-H82]EDR08693.1 predicted protein [Laccaria bicolor S238N-H82]|eukprot:XP_001880918.1 predicted protein [Laccaria bicolor S238N-H82]